MREWTAEQGRSPRMKRKGVEGFPVIHRVARAANEDFPGAASDRSGLARTRLGWDPYEVWRGRVEECVGGAAGREHDAPAQGGGSSGGRDWDGVGRPRPW